MSSIISTSNASRWVDAFAESYVQGQRNIFKTSQLTRGALRTRATYNRRQVLKLLIRSARAIEGVQQLYMEKTDRLRALGFNVDQRSYVGIPIYNFVEWYGRPGQLVERTCFEPHTGIWIRGCPLTDVFENDCDSFDAWHTRTLSISSQNDGRYATVADSMNVIFNQALDARDRYHQGIRSSSVHGPLNSNGSRMDSWNHIRVFRIATSNGIYELKIEGVDEAYYQPHDIHGSISGTRPASPG